MKKPETDIAPEIRSYVRNIEPPLYRAQERGALRLVKTHHEGVGWQGFYGLGDSKVERFTAAHLCFLTSMALYQGLLRQFGDRFSRIEIIRINTTPYNPQILYEKRESQDPNNTISHGIVVFSGREDTNDAYFIDGTHKQINYRLPGVIMDKVDNMPNYFGSTLARRCQPGTSIISGLEVITAEAKRHHNTSVGHLREIGLYDESYRAELKTYRGLLEACMPIWLDTDLILAERVLKGQNTKR